MADMTSERVIRANRCNAQASTGPRTSDGKARSGQNARTHGLTIKNSDLFDLEKIEHLAGIIAEEQCVNPMILDAARAVAAAHLHVRRVMEVKKLLIQEEIAADSEQSKRLSLSENLLRSKLLKKMEGLKRYEQEAFSRRRSAISRFDELVHYARQVSPKNFSK
jgi:hypothetical protein